MKGFVKNETERSVFRIQRTIPVNGSLSFDNAYLTLGEMSGLKLGIAFVKWLKENHFSTEGWCFYKEEGVPFFKKDIKPEPKPEVKKKGEPEVVVSVPRIHKKIAPAKGAGRKFTRNKDANEKKGITAKTIIEASIEDAKSLISNTKDRGVLKKALTLCNHFSKKEEHRRLVMKRLEEVYY